MTKNIKIAIGLIYILCLSLILYGFFIFIDVTQLNDYVYIRDKTQFLIEIGSKFIVVYNLVFFIFNYMDITFRFCTPISLIAGFLFGKFGTVL